MECDWEVEIGADSPVIDAAWDGYIDLRGLPSRISQIQETVHLPALHNALIRLNSPSSPVLTTKCDVWVPDSFDAEELDASPETAISGSAGYIDLIPAESPLAMDLDAVVDWCKRLCMDLKARPLRCCRADAVIRRACLTPDVEGVGVTMYVTGCGPVPEDASKTLSQALSTVADSVVAAGGFSRQSSKYNQNIVGE